MELTSDLIQIQSILSSIIKNTGEFTRVNYRGGNEDTILTVMVEIQKYLKSKSYITKDNKPNEIYDKQLQDVVLFLALNTSLKNPIELEEYSHVLNITPPLSKCLFANIVYGLDLCKYYCNVIEIFPLNFCMELLNEVLECLKKSTSKVRLEYSMMFLKAAADKLHSTDYCSKNNDDIDNICEVTNVILQSLCGIYSDQIKDLNQDQIYEHMGWCLLSIFELLLNCDQNCLPLFKFIVNTIRACTSIVKNVALNVYCAWAETDIDEISLQEAVSNKAYFFIESYQKFPEASELISILGVLARKPKSLTEQIYESDIETMIKKVNTNDKDQSSWFRALVRQPIFKHKEVVNCIRSWAHLCNEEDVSILLNWCVEKNNEESTRLFIRCAAILPLENLTSVATKHFYKNKFQNLASTDIEESLTLLLNKLKEDSHVDSDLVKDILLLFLQQPEVVLIHLYKECLTNIFYTNILKGTFICIKEIVKINNLGANVLIKVAEEKPPNVQNINCYINLLKAFLEIKYFTNDDILLKSLGPMVYKYYSEKLLEELDVVLQIFLGISLTFPVTESTRSLLEVFLKIMNENRCKFLNFDGRKQEIARHIVDICCDMCKPSYDCEMQIDIEDEDDFTHYYKLSFFSVNTTSLFRILCKDFEIENYGNCVTNLLKLLPPAVSREWLAISQEIVEICGTEKCLELLTDILILMSQLVETQDNDKNHAVYSGLKYCVQNYGLVIQQRLLNNATLETEMLVNKQICRLLAKLPNNLKEELGLSLVNLLTDRSLKSLAKDKDFLCQIILIKHAKVCQVLAQKITE